MNEGANYLAQNQKLFEVAVKEFSEKSYHYASLNDIVKKADFNKGSFYYRFTDKRMLYYTVLDLVNIEHLEIFNQLLLQLKNKNNVVDLSLILIQSIQELERRQPDYAQLLRMHTLFNLPNVVPIPETLTNFVFERYLGLINRNEQHEQLSIVQMLYYSYYVSRFAVADIRRFIETEAFSTITNEAYFIQNHSILTPHELLLSLQQHFHPVLIMGKSNSGKTTLANQLFHAGRESNSSVVLLNDQFRIEKKFQNKTFDAQKNNSSLKHHPLVGSPIPDKKVHHVILKIIKAKPELVLIDNSFSHISQSLSTLICDCLLKNLPKTCKIVLIVTTIPLSIQSDFEILVYNHYQLRSITEEFHGKSIDQSIIIRYQKEGIDYMEIASKEYLKSEDFAKKLIQIELQSVSPVHENPQLIYQHITGDVLE